jgi:hypothetical protein
MQDAAAQPVTLGLAVGRGAAGTCSREAPVEGVLVDPELLGDVGWLYVSLLRRRLVGPNGTSTTDRSAQAECDRNRGRNGLRQLPCRLQEQVELTCSGADTSAGCTVGRRHRMMGR